MWNLGFNISPCGFGAGFSYNNPFSFNSYGCGNPFSFTGLGCSNPINLGDGYRLPWLGDMFHNSGNLMWNQFALDSQARQYMGWVPFSDNGTFGAYPEVSNLNSPLLNPMTAIENWQWNSRANNALNFNIGSNGILNGGNMVFGSGSSGSSSSGSSSDATSDVEKSYQRKYNKLLSFLKQLQAYAEKDNSHILNDSKKTELENLINKQEGKTYEEKYRALKDFYMSIDPSKRIKFLIEGSDGLPINGKNGGTPLGAKLEHIGFEYANGKIEKGGKNNGSAIVDLHSRLEKINKEDAKLDDAIPNVSAYSALDIISSYNSKYTESKDDMLEMLFKAYDRVAKEQKDTVKNGFKPLVDALTSQAREIADEIGGDTKDKMDEIADKLDKAYEKFNRADIKKYFKQLYVMARIASAKTLENTLAGSYGEFDSELFKNGSFILDETIKDLKKEGLGNIVNSVKSSINLDANDVNTNIYEDANIDEIESSEKRVDKLRANEIINVASEKITVNGEEETVYEETVKTGNRTYKRKFILNDDGLFVEVKKSGDEYKTVGSPIKASTLQKDVNNAKKASNPATKTTKKAKSQAADTDETETATVTKSSESQSDLTYKGSKFYDILRGYTEDKYYTKIDETLGQLNSGNIVAFLKDYYQSSGYNGSIHKTGILEQVDGEHDGGKISMENKKNMVNALLERAREVGLEDDSDYREIKDRMSFYESGEEYADSQNFKHGKWFGKGWVGRAVTGLVGGAAAGAGIGALIGVLGGPLVAGIGAIVGGLIGGIGNVAVNRRKDNEYIDVAMKNLYNKIVAKESKVK